MRVFSERRAFLYPEFAFRFKTGIRLYRDEFIERFGRSHRAHDKLFQTEKISDIKKRAANRKFAARSIFFLFSVNSFDYIFRV